VFTRIFRHPWGWTTLAPLACTVHCLAAPVIVVAAPTLAPGTGLEWGLLVLTLIVAGLSLLSGVRTHADLRPVLPIGVGLFLWAASLLYLHPAAAETFTTAAAALTVAGGLLWNSRLHCLRTERACRACAETERPATVHAPAGEIVENPVSQSG
jgi:hypothetical protein